MTSTRLIELSSIFATGKRSEVIAAGAELIAEVRRRKRLNQFPGVRKTVGFSEDEVKHYALQRGWPEERTAKFFAHYEMVGWVYGRSKHQIQSLTAAMTTWEKNERRDHSPANGNGSKPQNIGSRFGVGA